MAPTFQQVIDAECETFQTQQMDHLNLGENKEVPLTGAMSTYQKACVIGNALSALASDWNGFKETLNED